MFCVSLGDRWSIISVGSPKMRNMLLWLPIAILLIRRENMQIFAIACNLHCGVVSFNLACLYNVISMHGVLYLHQLTALTGSFGKYTHL